MLLLSGARGVRACASAMKSRAATSASMAPSVTSHSIPTLICTLVAALLTRESATSTKIATARRRSTQSTHLNAPAPVRTSQTSMVSAHACPINFPNTTTTTTSTMPARHALWDAPAMNSVAVSALPTYCATFTFTSTTTSSVRACRLLSIRTVAVWPVARTSTTSTASVSDACRVRLATGREHAFPARAI